MKNRSVSPVESLESRIQLAADFSASLIAPVAGTVIPVGVQNVALVSVLNSGSESPRELRIGLALYASADDTLDPAGDLLLGTRTLSRMSAGESEVEDIEFAVPTSVATGTRVIYAVVDRADAVGESSETNNGSAMVNATFAAGGAGGGDDNGGDDNGGGGDDGGGDDNGGGGDDGGGDDNGGGGGGGRPNGIDLGTALVTPASAFVVGTEMKVYASIFNNGLTSSTARTTVEVFMMTGDMPNPATDRLVGVRQVSSVSAGENESEDIKIVFPANTPVGQYRLYAVIDRANRVVEASETNNVSEPVTVTLSPGVRDISGQIGRAIAPAAMVQGTSIGKSSVAFTYANNGTANFDRSAVATVRAYLRPVDAEDGSNDIAASDASRESLSSLTRGKSKSKELKLKVASTAPAGEYELIVKLDDGSSVSEIDESNNTLRTGRRIRIDMPTVDLSLVTPVFAASTRAGRPDLASVTVTNLGNSAFKGTSTVQFFYVDAEGVETAASSVISRRVDLKPGKTQKFDRVAMLARPTAAGEWTLVARVGGAAGDVNTENNAVTVRTFTV